MKILIVENEIYLSQSISSKLNNFGYNCDSVVSVKDAIKEEHYDVILLSTNLHGQNFYPVIERYKESIIILMVSYISNDTVTNPLKNGADDYIQKPFMIEELARKIEHFSSYNTLRKENIIQQKYTQHLFEGLSAHKISKNVPFPCVLRTNNRKIADNTIFEYAKEFNHPLDLIQINIATLAKEISTVSKSTFLYLLGFSSLKSSEQQKVLEIAKGHKIFLSTSKNTAFGDDINVIDLEDEEILFERGEVLSIDDYIKYVITTFQYQFPDTELSKKLGISRKSLWEKRKKYDIFKRK